jgi:hypothetical protein
MGSFAGIERRLTIEQTKAGLAAAEKQGRTGGRPHYMTHTKIESARQLLLVGTTPRDLANSLGVISPPSTVGLRHHHSFDVSFIDLIHNRRMHILVRVGGVSSQRATSHEFSFF